MAGEARAEAGFEYLDDVAIADVAFRAWGRTPEQVFRAACAAAMTVMVEDLDSIRTRERRSLVRTAARAEMLLFELLQELVYYKDAEGLLLLPEEIRVDIGESESRLQASLVGEKLERDRHPLKLDVKAVTLHRFALSHSPAGWQAQVVLDV